MANETFGRLVVNHQICQTAKLCAIANYNTYFFSWLDPLIWTGYRRELKQEDLYAVPDTCRSQKLLSDFKRYVFDSILCGWEFVSCCYVVIAVK